MDIGLRTLRIDFSVSPNKYIGRGALLQITFQLIGVMFSVDIGLRADAALKMAEPEIIRSHVRIPGERYPKSFFEWVGVRPLLLSVT